MRPNKPLIPIFAICISLLLFCTAPVFAATDNKDSENDTITLKEQLTTVQKTVQENAEEKQANGDAPKLSHGIMAITFDDGPGPYTDKLLDALKERNIHATFFVVGERVEEFSDQIKREYDEGHEIGNHSYNHTYLTKVEASDQTEEIQQTKDVLNKVLGKDVFGAQCVRPPGGYVDDNAAQNINAPVYLWSIDTLDWKSRDAEAVKNNIINQANDGAIILLHDLYESSVDGAIAAIDELSGQYIFCSVEEMFQRKGQTPENGVIYTNLDCDGVNLGYNAIKTNKTADGEAEEAKDSTKKEEAKANKQEKEFPWGAFAFCCCIVLIFLAALKQTLAPSKPEQKEKRSRSNKKSRSKKSSRR